MNYNATANRIQETLKNYGRVGLITLPSTIDILTGQEIPGQEKSIYVLEVTNKYKPIDGTIITATTKVYIASSFDINGMPIDIGVGHKIDNLQIKLVERIAPNGTVLMYRIYAE